jgi:hypothetical protein
MSDQRRFLSFVMGRNLGAHVGQFDAHANDADKVKNVPAARILR